MILKNIKKNILWSEKNNYKSFDPYAIKWKFLENIPLAGKYFLFLNSLNNSGIKIKSNNILFSFIKKEKILEPKTLLNFIEGYIYLYKKTKEKKYLNKAEKLAEILIKKSKYINQSPTWGHSFSYDMTIPKKFFYHKFKEGEFSLIISSLVCHCFLDLFEITKNKKYLIICEKFSNLLGNNTYYSKKDKICFWYIQSTKKLCINNANIYTASFLERLSKIKQNKKSELAKKSIDYILEDQNKDGSWYYFGFPDNEKIKKIDNYHTGFVLFALRLYYDLTKNKKCLDSLKKGLLFYSKMFSKNGSPFFTTKNKYPFDMHNAALGIIVFSQNQDIYKKGKIISKKILDWSLKEMYSEKGYFYFRKYKNGYIDKIPYMRWVQSWMFRAMTYYFMKK